MKLYFDISTPEGRQIAPENCFLLVFTLNKDGFSLAFLSKKFYTCIQRINNIIFTYKNSKV